VLLGGLELIKLIFVLAQIDRFRDPETGYGLLVKAPVVVVLDGKKNKTRGLSFKKGFDFKVGATDGFGLGIWCLVSVSVTISRRRG